MLAQPTQPVSLAQDASNIYWSDPVASSVSKLGKSGGIAQPLASGRPDPNSISVDSGLVYWAELANAAKTNQIGGVFSVPVGGGSVTPVLTAIDYPNQMLASQGFVLYTEVSGSAQPLLKDHSGTLSTLSAQGAAAVTVANGIVYWVTPASFNGNASQNYYNTDAVLMGTPLAGGATQTISTAIGYVGGIAVLGSYAYITLPGNIGGASNQLGHGSVVRIALADGSKTTLASDYMQALAIAVDSDNVYWLSFRDGDATGNFIGTGSIRKVPIMGGTSGIIVGGQVAPSSLVVDQQSLFWATNGTYSGTPGNGSVQSILPK